MTVIVERTVSVTGNIRYQINGKYHREDGPAFIGVNGAEGWAINGRTHRIDGPAITWNDGTVEWYVNNKRCDTIAEYKEAANLSDEDILVLILKYGNLMLGS